MKYTRTELFESVSVPKAIFYMAIPTVLNQLVTTIYNLADTFFIGQLNDSNMVASVSLCMPVFLLLISVGNLVGVGCSTLMSRSLGVKNPDRAKQASAFCFYASLIFALIVSAVAILFGRDICYMIGASEDTVNYTDDYLFWTIGIGAPSTVISLSMGGCIRAEGGAKHEMIGMVIGHVLNIVLDPIFIFGFGMNVAGVAIATFISNTVTVIYYVLYAYFSRHDTVVTYSIRRLKVNWPLVKEVFAVGIPAALMTTLSSVAQILMNRLASGYSDNAVAAIGIVKKIDMIPFNIIMGFTIGIIPLIGYNYAAKNYSRMRAVNSYTLKLTILIALICIGVFMFIPGQLVRIFIDDSEVLEMGAAFLRVACLSMPLMAINFTARNTFQAMGKGMPSFILAVCRQGLAFIPLLYLLNHLFGIIGLLWAQPIADLISAALSIWMYMSALRSLKHEEETEPEAAV